MSDSHKETLKTNASNNTTTKAVDTNYYIVNRDDFIQGNKERAQLKRLRTIYQTKMYEFMILKQQLSDQIGVSKEQTYQLGQMKWKFNKLKQENNKKDTVIQMLQNENNKLVQEIQQKRSAPVADIKSYI
eukprot:81542_1